MSWHLATVNYDVNETYNHAIVVALTGEELRKLRVIVDQVILIEVSTGDGSETSKIPLEFDSEIQVDQATYDRLGEYINKAGYAFEVLRKIKSFDEEAFNRELNSSLLGDDKVPEQPPAAVSVLAIGNGLFRSEPYSLILQLTDPQRPVCVGYIEGAQMFPLDQERRDYCVKQNFFLE
jgi:hypothetical protein